MNPIDATSMFAPPASPSAAVRAGQATGFEDFMRVSFDRYGSASESRDQQAKNAANQLLSVAFIKPMLAQMHQSPFKSELFHGGQGEKVFQEHLDTVLADRIATRMNVSLGDAIYRRITGTPLLNQSLPSNQQNHRIDQHG